MMDASGRQRTNIQTNKRTCLCPFVSYMEFVTNDEVPEATRREDRLVYSLLDRRRVYV